MSRPRRISDEEILSGVRRAVLQLGPHVSMDIVAEQLGVTAPALFRRFGSRTGLLLAALRPEASPPFLTEVERGPDDRPIGEQLVELFTHMGRHMLGSLPCLTALRESGIPLDTLLKDDDDPPPLRAVRALSGWLQRAARAGLIADVDPDGVAMAMLGAVQAPIFLRHLAKRTDAFDPAEHAAALARLFLSGVANKKSHLLQNTPAMSAKEP